MVYTGKLPLGKHNVSRIIIAADSLQMFDVAVSFKNVLSNIVNQPSAVPTQTQNLPHNETLTQKLPHTETQNLPQTVTQPQNLDIQTQTETASLEMEAGIPAKENVKSEEERPSGSADAEGPTCKRARLSEPSGLLLTTSTSCLDRGFIKCSVTLYGSLKVH